MWPSIGLGVDDFCFHRAPIARERGGALRRHQIDNMSCRQRRRHDGFGGGGGPAGAAEAEAGAAETVEITSGNSDQRGTSGEHAEIQFAHFLSP